MSGLLKGIGKVFKKVGKVALKVLPYAAAAAAVVFTGGAALGVLPSFAGAIGSVVGGLGLSTGLTGAITGAITNAGFGAAGGLLLGGKKGMKAGFLGGLVTGGVMGAVSPGLYGIDKAASAGATGAGSAAKDIGSVALKNEIGNVASNNGGGLLQSQGLSESLRNATLPAAKAAPIDQLLGRLPAVPDLVAAGGAKAGGGVLGFLNSNPALASQLLGGVSQAFAPNEYSQKAKAEMAAMQQAGFMAYGGGDANGKKKGGYVPGVYSGQADPFGQGSYGAPPMLGASGYYKPRSTRWAWDPVTSNIVETGY